MNKRNIKSGAFVVRTGSGTTSNKVHRDIGVIFPVIKDSSHGEAYYPADPGSRAGAGSISPSNWRYATDDEISAYHQGCRNVKDLKEYSSAYEIF